MFTMQFHFQRGNRVLSPARKVTHSVSLFCWYFNVYLSAFCLWAMGKCSWHHDIDISTNNFSKILSLCVSYFTSVYVMKWKDFFPNKELKEPPYFDARAVCYPNLKTIRDYLAWRQVDCKLLELIQIILYSKRHLIFVHTTFFFALKSYKETTLYTPKLYKAWTFVNIKRKEWSMYVSESNSNFVSSLICIFFVCAFRSYK